MNISKVLFDQFISVLPAPIAYTHLDKATILGCNEACLELFGFSDISEVMGKSTIDLELFAYVGQRDHIVEGVKSHKVFRNFEYPMRTKNGDNIWVSSSVISFEIDSTPVLITVLRDITKRREAEDAIEKLNKELEIRIAERTNELSKSEWGLKMAQKISHIGNWEIDFINKSTRWSDENYRIFGYEIGEVPPTLETYLSRVHPDDFEMVKNAIEGGAQNISSVSFVHRIIRKDGMTIYIYSESRYLFDESNNPIGVYGITHDVTQSKLAEDKLLSQFKALSEIAIFQSHHVRKPIAQILGLLNVLNIENPSDPQNIEVLKMLKETALTCDELIHELSAKNDAIRKL